MTFISIVCRLSGVTLIPTARIAWGSVLMLIIYDGGVFTLTSLVLSNRFVKFEFRINAFLRERWFEVDGLVLILRTPKCLALGRSSYRPISVARAAATILLGLYRCSSSEARFDTLVARSGLLRISLELSRATDLRATASKCLVVGLS